MATYEYNPNTGAKLKPGETVWDVANNRLITQGQEYGSGSSYTSAQNAAAQAGTTQTSTPASLPVSTPTNASQTAQVADLTNKVNVAQQAVGVKNQITNLQAQQAALSQYGLSDTNQLSQNASGQWVPNASTQAQLDQIAGLKTNISNAQTAVANKTATSATATPQTTPNANQAISTATAQMNANQTAGEAAISQAGSSLDDKFKEYTQQMTDAQNESNAKTEALLKKMGEDSTAQLLAQFQTTQQQIADGYKSYFDEQEKYLEALKNQPTAVQQLQTFREQQGLPQMEQQLAQIDQTIITTETLLSNLESDIKTRTEGLPVSQAAANRLIAIESKPLSKQLSEQLSARQKLAAGLETKLNTVNQFMSAASSDLATQKETALAKLGFAKEKAEITGDLATDSLNMFQTIQTNMNQINALRIDQISNDTQYRQALAEMGFTYYQQQVAEQKADIKDRVAYQNELVKSNLKPT